MYLCYIYLSSYSLQYGRQMEKAWVAHKHAEESGMSYRESERVVDSELFLDEYPRWGLGTPHQWCCIKCSFMPQGKGRKRQNICAAKAPRAVYPNLNQGQTYLPWNLWVTEHLGERCGTYTIVYTSWGGPQEPPPVGNERGEGSSMTY